MSEFYDQIFHPNSDYSVIIEDDGIVAYAYLLFQNDIIGDVWLYNQKSTPEFTDWENRENMPFLNPVEYVKDSIVFKPITNEADLKVTWVFKEDGNLEKALIFVKDKLVAILMPGASPGWSTLAKKDGPLANVIRQE